MTTKRLLLSLAVATALVAPSAHAIYLNTEAFRAAGGDPANPGATYDVGVASRMQRGLQAPFDAAGVFSGCSATWLGNDERNAWILTAKHCVSEGWRTMSFSTPTTSVSGVSRVFYPPGHGSGIAWDIALIQMPLPLATPQWNAITKPMLYDGNAEIGKPVHLLGYGVRGIGQTKTGSGRMYGTTRITHAFASETGLVSSYVATGQTDLQVRVASGDSGSSAWQQHAGGYWSIIGVTSTGGSTGSNFTRLNRHVEWIKRLYPGATTLSERLTVTQSKPFVSRNHAEDVDAGTVYYVIAPNQSQVQGPTKATWLNGVRTHTTINVIAKDAISGIERPIALRATRNIDRCGSTRMENAVICSSYLRSGALTVQYVAADNPGLPSGEWKAKFDVDAIGWHRTYKERLPISVDIRNTTQGLVKRDKAWVSPNFAAAASRGTVYYLVPKQAGAAGPSSPIWGGPAQAGTMQVLAREAVTGFERNIVLRTSRTSGCSTRQMHDGIICGTRQQGPMTVAFNAADNKDLPAGRWRGVAYVRAKGWHDHAVDEAIRVDVDIEQ